MARRKPCLNKCSSTEAGAYRPAEPELPSVAIKKQRQHNPILQARAAAEVAEQRRRRFSVVLREDPFEQAGKSPGLKHLPKQAEVSQPSQLPFIHTFTVI